MLSLQREEEEGCKTSRNYPKGCVGWKGLCFVFQKRRIHTQVLLYAISKGHSDTFLEDSAGKTLNSCNKGLSFKVGAEDPGNPSSWRETGMSELWDSL